MLALCLILFSVSLSPVVSLCYCVSVLQDDLTLVNMLNGKSENYEESRKTVAKLCEHCHLHKIHHRVMTLQGSRAQTAKMLGPVLITHNQSDDCY